MQKLILMLRMARLLAIPNVIKLTVDVKGSQLSI
jgi:hypothetical protein